MTNQPPPQPGSVPPPPSQPGSVPPPPSAPPPGAIPASPASAVVVVERVSKWFGDVVAVSDVSFYLQPGVTALLGPNGAGKSTTLRMIAGLAPTSRGDIRVLGGDPRTDASVRGAIGLVSQQEQLFAEQRAVEFVELAAILSGVTNPREAARSALRSVDLDPEDTRSIRTYSKGMRQRVKVAQALVHEPELLLLDEPLTGLDPRQRLAMTEMIQRLGAEGTCVVVSSHVLEEVERLGSNVLVIAQGRLAAQGDFHDIRSLMDNRPHRIRVRTTDSRVLGAALVTYGGVSGVELVSSSELLVDTNDVALFRKRIAPTARYAETPLLEVHPLDDDLESVFKYLVGR